MPYPPRGLFEYGGYDPSALGNPLAAGTPQGLLGAPDGEEDPMAGLLGAPMDQRSLLRGPFQMPGEVLQRTPAMRGRPEAEMEIGKEIDMADRNKNRIGGVVDALAGTGAAEAAAEYGPNITQDARRQAMLQAGLSLMGSGGRGINRPNMGQALQLALGQGQQAYQGAVGQAAAAEGITTRRDIERKRKAIYAKYAGKMTNTTALGNMMGELAAIGDTEGLGPLSNVYNAMAAGGGERKLEWQKDENGGWLYGLDASTGELVKKYPLGTKSTAGATADDLRADRRLNAGVESDLRSGFRKDTSSDLEFLRQIQPILGPLNDAIAKSQTPNGAIQMATLFKFVNALDNTAAREGETQLAREKAASLADQIRLLKQKYGMKDAALVPPGLLEEIRDFLNDRGSQAQYRVDDYKAAYQAAYKRNMQTSNVPDDMFTTGNLGPRWGAGNQKSWETPSGPGSKYGGLMNGVTAPGSAPAGAAPAAPEQPFAPPQPAPFRLRGLSDQPLPPTLFPR